MKRLVLILALLATPLAAVEPDEMLADPALEARAQALDEELRCVKCQSENIASSNADWAKDARVLVRELISEGKSDDEVMAFFVARYGDFVKMRPDVRGANVILWGAGPLMLLIAGLVAFGFMRGRAKAEADIESAGQTTGLTPEEQARLKRILDD